MNDWTPQEPDDSELDDLSDEFTHRVGAIFDGTTSLVKKLRKQAVVMEELGTDLIELSAFVGTMAAEVARIGSEMIKAERLPADDVEEEEIDEED